VQAQHLAAVDLRFHRFGQFFQLGADHVVEGLALVGQLHRLVLAGEEALAGEVFQRGDPARERRGAERQFVGGRLGRTEADDANEGFKRAQGGESAYWQCLVFSLGVSMPPGNGGSEVQSGSATASVAGG